MALLVNHQQRFQIWVVDSDWSHIKFVPSDWLSSKINKIPAGFQPEFSTETNANKSDCDQELPLLKAPCCISFYSNRYQIHM